jgi:hypothetical protein
VRAWEAVVPILEKNARLMARPFSHVAPLTLPCHRALLVTQAYPPVIFKRYASTVVEASEAETLAQQLSRDLRSYGQGGEFANPTTDTGFKHLFSPAAHENKSIIISFLNTFVPDFAHDKVVSVEEAPIVIPALPKSGTKQTFMDMHVISQAGVHYVIEMQAQRHIYFDERALFYAYATYSRQISDSEFKEELWYRKLKPVIAIQVLDYDSNRAKGITDPELSDTLVERVEGHALPKGEFIKHFLFQDKKSGQSMKDLQVLQIELPRVKKNLFPPQRDFTPMDWWLSILKFAPKYTQAMLNNLKKEGTEMPETFQKALERLYFPKWNPTEIVEYKSDTIEREKYAIHFATERSEGFKEGEEKGRKEGRLDGVAKLIRSNAITMEQATKTLGLSEEDLVILRKILSTTEGT